ncbi:MAG: ADP-ribosylglycohydrolase family protein [Clostridia bacterium]|nr:ADP-ribosylglycohydrolase family protein [Clostridia bacterium]
MTVGNAINKLRTEAKLTQEQFATLFGVSQQSVQKWENGLSTPDLERLVKISKYFDVSLDALILGNDNRIVEEMSKNREIKPQYPNIHRWEFYPSNLRTEYRQSIEEGLDMEAYEEIFRAVAALPQNEIKKKLGDILFEVVMGAKQKEGYPYIEPSDLERIRELRKPSDKPLSPVGEDLERRIAGAWMGRICGCMLGKPIEGVRTAELIPFLTESGNYPMHRYIYRSDITPETTEKYRYAFAGKQYADEIDGMPVDDDTNYTVLAQKLITKYGRDFTPYDVSQAWMKWQSKDAYCTAERVAFCNFVNGYTPPESAIYKNPYREWIGAQIRGDYFGYINPGNPELAAEMAWRDASISHIKNGIYGEMWVAAMLAVAATTRDPEKIISGGLGQIPHTSRLYEKITSVLEGYRGGVTQKECFKSIHQTYDENSSHDWCHTISNAMIVAAALLYGKGDFAKSICMAVETGFDTDCNGATVGSVLGMAYGIESIPETWTKPIQDTLHTSIFKVGTVKISDCVRKTLEHIKLS